MKDEQRLLVIRQMHRSYAGAYPGAKDDSSHEIDA